MTEIVFTRYKCLRCLYCDRRWPAYEEFAVCPCCREETDPSTVLQAMPEEEARKLAIEFEFGWYLYTTGQL